MGQVPTLHLLYSCPFCWKVRGLIEYLKLDVNLVGVNGMKIKKEVKFAGDWGKVPVFTDENGTHHVDSTPLLKHIDQSYNNGAMANQGDNERQEKWLNWADTKMSKATVPILYGLYAWAGFPVMWGIIARKRVKKDGRTPKKLWHDLLTEFTAAHESKPFFGGETPDLVDFAAYGYMRSISPFPQFSLLTDHESGMAWYNRMEASIQ